MAKNEYTVTIGPSVELEEYTWLKTSVTVSYAGNPDRALKEAERLYWKAVLLDLRLRNNIETAYEKDKMTSLKSLAEKKIDKLEARLSKKSKLTL